MTRLGLLSKLSKKQSRGKLELNAVLLTCGPFLLGEIDAGENWAEYLPINDGAKPLQRVARSGEAGVGGMKVKQAALHERVADYKLLAKWRIHSDKLIADVLQKFDQKYY